VKRGAIWSLAAAGVSTIGALLVTPRIIGELGVADFGLYVLVVTVTSYAAFFDLGLPFAATRFFAEDMARGRPDRLTSRFHTLSRVLLAIGVAGGAAAAAAGPWLAQRAGATGVEGLAILMGLSAVSVVIALQGALLHALLNAAQRFDEAGRVTLAMSVMTPVAAFTAIRMAPGLASLIAATIAVNAAGVLFSTSLVRRHRLLQSRGPRWETDRLREMASFGGWSSAGRIVMALMLQLDRLVVALIGSVTGLAGYAVAAQIASKVNALGGVATSLVFSRASLLHAGNRLDALDDQRRTVRRILLWGTLGLALPLATLGPAFLEAWVGAEMRTMGGPILVMLAAAHGIVSVTALDAAVLEGAARPDLTAKTMAVWAVPAGCAGFLLQPSLQATAVGVAVALWLGGVGVTTIVLSRRLFPERASDDHRRLLKGLAGAVCLSLIVKSGVEPALAGTLPSVLGAMALSAAAVLLFGGFTVLRREDRLLLLGWDKPYGPSVEAAKQSA
jgi:O-antigen/teichoic acid export membrane protein